MQDQTYTRYPTRLLFLSRGTGRLESLGTRSKYPKNYILAEPDTVPDCCYLVVKGRVMAYDTTTDGVERIYNFMETGSLLLDCNVLMQQPALVYFKTLVPSELICIKRSALLNAMKEDEKVMMDVVESITDKFLSSMDQVRELSSHNVSWRMCNLLLIFADRYGAPGHSRVVIREKISQRTIASLLCINRVTAVRAIKKLKDLGLLNQVDGFYCINDVEALRDYQGSLSDAD